MKLNYKRIILVGFAFFLIQAFWQAYDNTIPMILTNKFGMSQTWSGVIMALDNVLALFLLPLFGHISDKCTSRRGRRTPFIVIGTLIAAVALVCLSFVDNAQLKNLRSVSAIDDPAALTAIYQEEKDATLLTPSGEKFILGQKFTEEEFTAIRSQITDGDSTVTNPDYPNYVGPARQACAWQMTAEHPSTLIFFVVLLLLISLRSEPITSKVIYAVEDNALCGQTGLQAGDEIVAVNGRHCFVANDMLYELMRTESYRADFTVRRDGKLVELPDVQFDTWQDEQGQTHMTLGFTVYGLKKTPQNVLKESANSVIYYGRIIYTSLADLLRGRESINDLSGPVGIVTAIGQAASYGWEDVAELLALITINLGVLNLLPFPALDGGKIVFLLIEAVTGHAVPEKIQSSLTVAAFALLFGLMLFATYNDIVRLVTGAI